MLALPTLGGMPTRLSAGGASPLAARLALAIVGDDKLDYRIGHAPERRTLEKLLQARHARATAGLHHLHCSLLVVDRDPDFGVSLAPEDGEYIGSEWTLERRWQELERTAPGLAGSALSTIDAGARAGLPIYLPGTAEHYASYAWWGCEMDEKMVLEQIEEGEAVAGDHGVPLRRDFDAALPKHVQHPRSAPLAKLTAWARRRDRAGDVARATLALRDLLRADRRRAATHELVTEDENGALMLGYAAALRWNAKDPMYQVFDDFAHDWAQGSGVEAVYGYYEAEDPAELETILQQVERRLEIARATERLLELVADRSR